jgi:hypothetical protein
MSVLMVMPTGGISRTPSYIDYSGRLMDCAFSIMGAALGTSVPSWLAPEQA